MTSAGPKGWAARALQDVAEVVRGITFPSAAKSKQPGPGLVKCLRTSNVQRTLTFEDVLYVPVKYVKREAQWLMSGDTVISTANSSALVGKVAFATAAPERTAIGGFISIIRPKAIDPRFLWYQLSSPQVQEQFKRSASQTVNISNLSLSGLLPTRLVAPPIEEQRHIADALDSYFSRLDAVEAGLERVQRNLKRYRASVLQAAVTGRLVPTEAELARQEGRLYEPAADLIERPRHAQDTQVNRRAKRPSARSHDSAAWPLDSVLPEGWACCRLSEVAEVQLGQQRHPKYAEGKNLTPYVRAANITWDGLDLRDTKAMAFPDADRYRLEFGDLLMAEASGSPMEVGKPAVWRNEIPGACYQKTLLRIRPFDKSFVLPEYLRLVILRDCLAGKFAKLAPGVGIVHITAVRLKDWTVQLPPGREQRRIVEETDRLLSVVSNSEEQCRHQAMRINQFRQAILSSAFAGQLVS